MFNNEYISLKKNRAEAFEICLTVTHRKKRILQPDPGQTCMYVFIKLKQEFHKILLTFLLPVLTSDGFFLLVYEKERRGCGYRPTKMIS